MITETPSLHPAGAGAPPHPPGPDAADGLALRANKLDLLERLADDLAHEIKNPLHSMVINLEVLKRRVARADAAEEVQRYIGVLAGELERVNRRIELLLRLSRPGRGAENTTLNELAEEVMELIQLEARHHDIQVEYRPEGGMARVHVPREPSRQVILNLVLEVMDRMQRGGTLCISVAEENGESRLALADSGRVVAALCGDPSPRMAAAHALAEAVGGRVEAREAAGAPALVFALPLANKS
ncbi:histidine kinase dimerization/phospho-acceptor domain-containing protein [Longimicrobium sp.]|uniref:histidine kinase dimerization/phospho-acceptor domain-containing protein n=1 Tax=Longimicrobium sp. TaxID=2029185 RepID=UPI002C493CF9|nr:histidine kinase dimerization/phospho-acceptor domain-containing protein [Longimicrobium sp.]HSU12829.1 histidine kinase dimerization/phospho-acceptor domain-containing protein [Longimicrobium sp.]